MAALPVCASCGSSELGGRMLHCESCLQFFHGACAKAPAAVLARLQQSPSSAAGAARRWQCNTCKRCAVCDSGENDDTLLLCDGCDEAAHMNCARPPVKQPGAQWYCSRCAGAPGGSGGPKRRLRVSGASQQSSASPKKRRGSPADTASCSTATPVKSPLKGRRADDSPQAAHRGPTYHARVGLTSVREQVGRRRQQASERESNADDSALPPIEAMGSREDVELFLDAERSLGHTEPAADRRSSPSGGGGGAGDLVDQCDIKRVVLGAFSIATWYGSPYPCNLSRRDEIFVCEFCLKPLETETVFRRHCEKCVWRHPPGNEIYNDAAKRLSVWEVDGQIAKTYCQSLCLLAKLWLLNKTLYFKVEPFLFYVLTKEDDDGCKIVGYFSKEKRSDYNLSCIMVMPSHMRGGYGSILIDFSYLLTRKEGRTGSPEGPLSDLGLIAYRRYWTDVILERIAAGGGVAGAQFSLRAISQETGIHINDIVSTLLYKGMIKIWMGRYMLYKDKKALEQLAKQQQQPRRHRLRAELLRWRPPAGSGAGTAASSSDDADGDSDGEGRQAG